MYANEHGGYEAGAIGDQEQIDLKIGSMFLAPGARPNLCGNRHPKYRVDLAGKIEDLSSS